MVRCDDSFFIQIVFRYQWLEICKKFKIGKLFAKNQNVTENMPGLNRHKVRHSALDT